MSLFGAIGISGSGIDAAQSWINTAAGNIANANDVVPTSQAVYGQETPIFTPQGSLGQVGDGVAVSGYDVADTEGVVEYQPDNPMHDNQGDVRVANIDLGSQMVGLISAQTDYQANASALSHAKQAYQSALTLGS
ncbi:MAG TPA: flagellar basal body rod C-terminal domain-containing protein [Acidimicrobiales bacterium]|jgi:flagellar basal-body rod protein FlgC|nr:flagellar basal body rod C-terminal domain-containing protein [Acidimicrobiales bacterium]